MKVSVILVAGGIGTRFGATIPKQFLLLGEKPIARHSFDLFATMPEVLEIIVVCANIYQNLFPKATRFALPGERRQDSVQNGLMQVSQETNLVCIHDAARPLVREREVRQAFQRAAEVGAVALASPVKCTIKRCNAEGRVEETLVRDQLWEVQTPQVIRTTLLRDAYQQNHTNATVTDDLSLIEKQGHPVYLITGDYRNLKITTAEDLELAQRWLLRSEL